MYESYPGFVLHAMKAFWREPRERTDVLCLLLAEPTLTVPNATRLLGTDRMLRGAAGAAALALLLRSLRGAAGWTVTGVTVASLLTLYVRRRERIGRQVKRYRQLLTRYRQDYEDIQRDFASGRLNAGQRQQLIGRLYDRLERALLAQEELTLQRQERPAMSEDGAA